MHLAMPLLSVGVLHELLEKLILEAVSELTILHASHIGRLSLHDELQILDVVANLFNFRVVESFGLSGILEKCERFVFCGVAVWQGNHPHLFNVEARPDVYNYMLGIGELTPNVQRVCQRNQHVTFVCIPISNEALAA